MYFNSDTDLESITLFKCIPLNKYIMKVTVKNVFHHIHPYIFKRLWQLYLQTIHFLWLSLLIAFALLYLTACTSTKYTKIQVWVLLLSQTLSGGIIFFFWGNQPVLNSGHQNVITNCRFKLQRQKHHTGRRRSRRSRNIL